VDLSSEVLAGLLHAARAEPQVVSALVWGCASPVGAQALNIGRRAALAAGWPEDTTALTVEAHAISSLEAVSLGAAAIAAGHHDVVVAGGVESTSFVPLGAALAQPVTGKPFGQRLAARYRGGGGFQPPGAAAEGVASRHGLARAELDSWALRSFERARLWEGRQHDPPPPSLVPLALAGGQVLSRDEALARPPTARQLARLQPAFLAGGKVTAGNLAAEGDGASAVLLASTRAARAFDLRPLALLAAVGRAGVSPGIWPEAAAPAAQEALSKAGLANDKVARWHVVETSAAAVLAFSRDVGANLELVNLEGGALATTAPLGAVGAGLFSAALEHFVEGENGPCVVCGAGDGGLGLAFVLVAPPP
jgi:acetyl-CoA acyltransferase